MENIIVSPVVQKDNEYIRMILNTYYSKLFHVDVSDSPSFIRNDGRVLKYKELRLLLFLRNKQFTYHQFLLFLNELHEETPLLKDMKIDPHIFEVMKILMYTVRDPLLIDKLIRTHRLISCLWKNGSKFLYSYTLHNEEHSVELIKNVVRLSKIFNYFNLTNNDYYDLFLACYLHDISMVVHPSVDSFNERQDDTKIILSRNLLKFYSHLNNREKEDKSKKLHEDTIFISKILLNGFKEVYSYFENRIRKNHPSESAKFIMAEGKSSLDFLGEEVKKVVADVSKAHGSDSSEVYGRRSETIKGGIHVKFQMILLRLADLLDMTNDRVNIILLQENIKHMDEVSRFHWISHLVVDKVVVNTDYPQLPKNHLKEVIFIEIYLNCENLIDIQSNKKCKGYTFEGIYSEDKRDGKKCKSLVLSILNSQQYCKRGKCPLICKWMCLKNNYLMQELVELKQYIKYVNHSLFDQEIKVKYILSNQTNMVSFLPSIKNYIEKNG